MKIKDNASDNMNGVKEEAKVLKGEASKDKTYSTSRIFDDADSATFEFSRSVERLFNVNNWSNIPGVANANFELFDPAGNPLQKSKVAKGDFIKIDLPGPLPYYWVKVTDLKEEKVRAEFTVQPTYDPTHRDDKTITDHFFQDRARSIFRVELDGREIVAMEIGLDEAINNQEAEAGKKGLVNTIVSEVGWAGFQKYQWKNLTDYIVGIRTPAT